MKPSNHRWQAGGGINVVVEWTWRVGSRRSQKGNIDIYVSLNDNESMPIRPAIDVERCALLKHGRTPPLSQGNWPELWEQMNALFNSCEWQHDAGLFAIFIDALFDLVHTMIPIGLSWEW